MKTPPEIIWFCPKCKEEGREPYNEIICSNICPKHKVAMQEINISSMDYFVLKNISSDFNFIEAMIKLKDDDIIEYQSRMSQFRNQIEQQEQIKKQSEEQQRNQVRCPKCGSIHIAEGTRGYTLTTGFIGSSKFRYICKNCGFKWKPGGWSEALLKDLYRR